MKEIIYAIFSTISQNIWLTISVFFTAILIPAIIFFLVYRSELNKYGFNSKISQKHCYLHTVLIMMLIIFVNIFLSVCHVFYVSPVVAWLFGYNSLYFIVAYSPTVIALLCAYLFLNRVLLKYWIMAVHRKRIAKITILSFVCWVLFIWWIVSFLMSPFF